VFYRLAAPYSLWS